MLGLLEHLHKTAVWILQCRRVEERIKTMVHCAAWLFVFNQAVRANQEKNTGNETELISKRESWKLR